ncbi:hypothetical protein [Pseudoduganella aquatica]|uniref:hypothetical protein n=1 Tax=Pseudoduganella aquatica TaxID=2660641 RepID=UPI001E6297E6|nr:hypothetical protein [Pseudoduganella aquatica]
MKKFSRKQWASAVSLAATSTLLIVGLIFAISEKGVASAEAAAWLQAAGSVGAILVAIFVMNAQHARTESAQQQQAVTERASVIAALAFFFAETQILLKTAVALVEDGAVPRDKSQVLVDRLESALASISTIPIWKNALDEAAEIRLGIAACRNVLACVEAAEAADHRVRVRFGRTGVPSSYPAKDLHVVVTSSAATILGAQTFLDQRYNELTGQRLDI